MSNSDFQKRTCSNYDVAIFMKHLSSSGGVSKVEAVADSAPLIYEWQESNDMILEPTPFREGASLQPLPHSGNMFVLIAPATKRFESCISSAIACIMMSDGGSCQPSSGNVEHTLFTGVEPALPAIIRHTMPLAASLPAENISSSSRSTKTRDQKLDAKSQVGQWEERFQQLLQFKARYGHCLVPHAYPENPSFARWAKRQRYQYKLLRNHKPSVMTEERVHKLESVGFIYGTPKLWRGSLD